MVEPELIQVPVSGAIAIGRIPSISEIVIAFTALTSGIGCYVFSDKVLCQSVQEIRRSGGLADDAGNFLDALRDIVSNLQDLNVRKSIVASLQRVNPSVSSVELNDIQNPSKVVVGHRLNGRTLDLDLSQESDGFRRFYAHLLAIYQRPPKQTLSFEHPEDGIHPGALSLLADEFRAAPEEGHGQVILTTHSPRLLDHFEVDQIRVVDETWLIAGATSLAGRRSPDGRLIKANAKTPRGDLEAGPRDAKGWLRGIIEGGYKPARDQAVLTKLVDLEAIRARELRSFRRLESAVSGLLQAIRTDKPITSPL